MFCCYRYCITNISPLDEDMKPIPYILIKNTMIHINPKGFYDIQVGCCVTQYESHHCQHNKFRPFSPSNNTVIIKYAVAILYRALLDCICTYIT